MSESARFSGAVVAGYAACELSLMSADGTTLTTAVSGADGRFGFNATLAADQLALVARSAGPGRLLATNCTYQDETSGQTVAGADLSAPVSFPSEWAQTGTAAPDTTLAVTPLTRMLDELQRDGTSIRPLANALSARLLAPNAGAEGSGVGDLLSTIPSVAVNPTSSTTDAPERAYGLALAAVSGMGELDEAVATLVAGAAEGPTDSSGAPVALSGPAVTALLDGAARFEATGRNTSGVPATVALAGLVGGMPEADNTPPSAMKAALRIVLAPGEALELDLASLFTDTDGDALVFHAADLPAGFALERGHIRGAATAETETAVGITAFDERGGGAALELRIDVTQDADTPTPPPPPPAVNRAPVAEDDRVTLESATATLSVPVLDNDTDPDGDSLRVAAVLNVEEGISAEHQDESVRVTGLKAGTWSLDYRVTDGKGGSDTARLTVSVPEAPPPQNSAPEARFVATPASGTTETTFTFDASASTDSDGSIDSYVWDFGDGVMATGQTASTRYAKPGVYTVTLTVADDAGAEAATTTEVEVGAAAAKLTVLETREEAARFLIQAGFGGTDAEIDALVGTDAAEWVAAEIAKAPTLSLATMQSRYPTEVDTGGNFPDLVWTNMIEGDDVLRQRMFFALSQIFVYNVTEAFSQGYKASYFTDQLTENAFGNYRELLEDVTYSVAMGDYLTYYGNVKANERTGAEPDENYAREILQLFSIGLTELNMDGTPKAGAPETYTNADIVGLARVFTGLRGKSASGEWNRPDSDFRWHRMEMFEDRHSEKEKQFLGTTIPAGTSGTESIRIALDDIARHPNVAPFISRQLIQRFTASSPSPAYVRRVAMAFDTGTFVAPNGRTFGAGRQGDFEAAIAAVLLDETVHDDVQDPNEGKVREPVLQFIQHLRTFDVAPDGACCIGITSSPEALSQTPMRSPSVFNFFRPGFQAPVSETGDMDLTAPELQIVTAGGAMGFLNYMADYVFQRVGGRQSHQAFVPDFTEEMALADDVPTLVDNLNTKMVAGQLTDAEREEIISAVEILELAEDTNDEDRLARVRLAVFMVIASGAYGAQN